MSHQLLHPLSQEQIAAATEIHDAHMPGWAAADRALDLLREAIPQFSHEEVLIKAATVDRLYFARHMRLTESIGQIVQTMTDPPPDAIAIVEAIAPLKSDGSTSSYWSFSSKFVHFFVDPAGVPIYDDWAIKAIRHHFGRLSWIGKTPYRAFAEYVFALRELGGVSCSIRELDRYLWLSGMLRGWRKSQSAGISGEVRAVFESSDREVQAVLTQLAG